MLIFLGTSTYSGVIFKGEQSAQLKGIKLFPPEEIGWRRESYILMLLFRKDSFNTLIDLKMVYLLTEYPLL